MKVPLRWQFWSPENLKYSDGGALEGMLWGKMLHKIQVLRTCISRLPELKTSQNDSFFEHFLHLPQKEEIALWHLSDPVILFAFEVHS